LYRHCVVNFDSYSRWTAAVQQDGPLRDGIEIILHSLDVGLLDEIHVDMAAILFGSGFRLFEHLAGTPAVPGNLMVIPGVGITRTGCPVRSHRPFGVRNKSIDLPSCQIL
jgi:hypothetical protein